MIMVKKKDGMVFQIYSPSVTSTVNLLTAHPNPKPF